MKWLNKYDRIQWSRWPVLMALTCAACSEGEPSQVLPASGDEMTTPEEGGSRDAQTGGAHSGGTETGSSSGGSSPAMGSGGSFATGGSGQGTLPLGSDVKCYAESEGGKVLDVICVATLADGTVVSVVPQCGFDAPGVEEVSPSQLESACEELGPVALEFGDWHEVRCWETTHDSFCYAHAGGWATSVRPECHLESDYKSRGWQEVLAVDPDFLSCAKNAAWDEVRCWREGPGKYLRCHGRIGSLWSRIECARTAYTNGTEMESSSSCEPPG